MSIEKFTGKIKKPKKINQVKKGNPLEGFEYHTRPSDLFENGLDYVLNGMKSVAKHFPGHGGVKEDSHIELPIDNRDLSMIWECDLAPFRILIKNNLSAIMMAHIHFKKVDK